MKLYRFEYSCYARKVQMTLDLLGLPYELVDVPYGDRETLAQLAGGYIQVPVLEDGRRVIVDSRCICQALVERSGERLVPAGLEGPVWAYADWADSVLEDLMFRLASPQVRERFPKASERALFTYVKERKFGPGCVEQWARDRGSLLTRAQALLLPTARTLARRPFLLGERPSLADAALYGEFAMVRFADPALPAQLGAVFPDWMARLEAAARP